MMTGEEYKKSLFDGRATYFGGEKVLCVGEGAVASGANLDWTLAVPAAGEPVYRK